jgi:hypothetical protein
MTPSSSRTFPSRAKHSIPTDQSSFRRGAAVTQPGGCRARPGFQTSTRGACAPQMSAVIVRYKSLTRGTSVIRVAVLDQGPIGNATESGQVSLESSPPNPRAPGIREIKSCQSSGLEPNKFPGTDANLSPLRPKKELILSAHPFWPAGESDACGWEKSRQIRKAKDHPLSSRQNPEPTQPKT